MILSFDIGIKNLAYCCLDHNGTVFIWDRVDIGVDHKNIQVLVNAMIDMIDDVLYTKLSNFDLGNEHIIFLIENQPVLKNPVMKNLQIIIATYATLLEKKGVVGKVDIHFVSASSKIKLIEAETGTKIPAKSYSANKKASVDHTRTLVERSDNHYMKCVFAETKKKDDISDVYLQARWWMKNNARKIP
jgi:hypothetical protein